MTKSVVLDNLRDMTGGDKEIEKELFSVYLSASEGCFSAMKASTAPGQEETWRTQAHAWKGMSLNLGAEPLGKLCAQAQMNHMASQDEKKKMLNEIEAEFVRVQDFLAAV